MQVTLDQWKQFQEELKAIEQAIEKATNGVLWQAQCKMSDSTNLIHPDAVVLQDKVFNPLLEMLGQVKGLKYITVPQSEWMGGDSSNPKNFKFREPHVVPAPRGYLAEKFENLNKAVAGTGFQFFVDGDKIRVASEGDDSTIRHFISIYQALKIMCPLGCGSYTLDALRKLADENS